MIPEDIERALCNGHPKPDLWFPNSEKPNAYGAARAVCRRCPVRLECLNDAMDTERDVQDGRHGMWGGLTPSERHRRAEKAAR